MAEDNNKIEEIKAAVAQLDPANDDHWTSKDLPAMKAIEDIVGDAEITRADVEEAVGDFVRPEVESVEETQEEIVETEDKPEPEVDEKRNSVTGRNATFEECMAFWRKCRDAEQVAKREAEKSE